MNFLHATIQTNKQGGFALVELLVGVALTAIVMLAIVGLSAQNLRLSGLVVEDVQADFLLEEAAEAVKLIRDDGWSNLSSLTLDTAYGLSFAGNTWSIATSPVAIDGFTRSVTFSEVERDAITGAIGSGSVDTQTLLVTVDVDWEARVGARNRELGFYITDFFAE